MSIFNNNHRDRPRSSSPTGAQDPDDARTWARHVVVARLLADDPDSATCVDVDFPVTADLHKFPDFLITMFVNVSQRVREGVQDALAQMLSGAQRKPISRVVTAVVKGLTGVPPGATIHGVKVTTDRIVLTYFED